MRSTRPSEERGCGPGDTRVHGSGSGHPFTTAAFGTGAIGVRNSSRWLTNDSESAARRTLSPGKSPVDASRRREARTRNDGVGEAQQGLWNVGERAGHGDQNESLAPRDGAPVVGRK